MDTFEIDACLSSDPFVNAINGGVYAADELPHKISKPSVIVVNTDPSTKAGTHWVALFFDDQGNCEYFNSYGTKPDNRWHESFIKRNCVKWTHNTKCLQALYSDVCGVYCIMYACFKSRNKSLDAFNSLFSECSPDRNDTLVSMMFQSHYSKIALKSSARPRMCRQSCTHHPGAHAGFMFRHA